MTDKPEGLALLAEAGRWITYEEALRAQRLPVDDPYFEQLYCSCLASASVVLPGTSLYRARYMPPERATDTKPFAIEDMGPPPPEVAGDNRLSRKGVPCFYAALDPDTAIAELRLWKRARVSVAMFTTTQPLNVLNLRWPSGGKHSYVVYWAAQMIQRPVHEHDPLAYLGTQYLADKLKDAGALGLLYDSGLTSYGTNVAIFNFDTAGLSGEKAVSYYEVVSVDYRTVRFDELGFDDFD